MHDQYGRTIDYMRISVTDRCNLRCAYCMPEGVPLSTMDDLLTYEEIAETAAAAADLGIRHIKLTGGEPLVRRGLPSLVRLLKETGGIEKVTLTTNGTMLEKNLDALIQAGLDAVNISLDCLDRETYRRITGTDALETVLSAVEAACRAGIRTKINAVSLDLQKAAGGAALADPEKPAWKALAELAKDRPLDVRFIEIMPIGYGKSFAGITHEELLAQIRAKYPGLEEDHTVHGFGPAVYYRIPGWQGSIGLISALHGKFCGTCNRVRLTSEGYLKACLCYDQGADLREILRAEMPAGEKEEKLREVMRSTIFGKPREHCFEHPKEITEEAAMIVIGG